MLQSRLSVAIAFSTLAVAAVAAVVADDPTPALTLIGALVLAIIAAETADTRQLRQIEADAERQTRALEAERERHLATLTHDRELADVADLRALLDKAASRCTGATDARSELNAAGEELDALGARFVGTARRVRGRRAGVPGGGRRGARGEPGGRLARGRPLGGHATEARGRSTQMTSRRGSRGSSRW